MAMSLKLKEMLDEAHGQGTCVRPHTDAEAQRLRRAAHTSSVVSPVRGVFIGRAHWDELSFRDRIQLVMHGLQEAHPSWVFAGPSAAIAHGLWVSNKDLLPIRIAANRNAHGAARGLIFPQSVGKAETVEVDGLRCTTLLRSAYDCLRELDFAHGLAVADSALRAGGLSREELLSILAIMGPGRGALHAKETARHADPRAQSGGESITRARIITLGYELPELQVELPNLIDGGVFYGDFGWMRNNICWLVGELDGHEKYQNPTMTKGASTLKVLSNERLRESRITALRIPVMRFSFADVMNNARFKTILDAYGVPRAIEPGYECRGRPFIPSGVAKARAEALRRWPA